MKAGAAALLFDLGEIGALIPVGFGIVVIRKCVEARGFCGCASDDGVGHADDGGGVHAAAKLREDWTVGTQTATNGLAKNCAEVLLVFSVGAVTDSLVRVKIPILRDGVSSRSEHDERRRRDRVYYDVRRQVSRRKKGKPAGDVFFAEGEGFASKENKWVEDRAPGHLIVVERIVEMACADWVFS